MKNPFLSSTKYTVQKQYERIMERSRSNSQSSFNSNCSYSKPPFQASSKDQRYHLRNHKFIQEYSDQRWGRQLQERRVRAYGVQQLRYKPKYLDNDLQKLPERRRSSASSYGSGPPPQIILRAVDRPILNKKKHRKSFMNSCDSLKNMNSSQSSDHILTDSTPLEQNQRNQANISQQSSAYLKTLVNLQAGISGINENYTSIADLRSVRCLKNPQPKCKKRTSCFYQVNEDQKQQFPALKRRKSNFSSSNNFLTETLTSNKTIESQNNHYYFQENQMPTTKKKKKSSYWDAINQDSLYQDNAGQNSSQGEPPSSIFVRNKIFFFNPIRVKK